MSAIVDTDQYQSKQNAPLSVTVNVGKQRARSADLYTPGPVPLKAKGEEGGTNDQ